MNTERRSLYFTSPGEVNLVEEELCPLEPGQVCVRTLLSAISPGTEMLIYRGQFPEEMLLDESIASLNDTFSYPTKYGYSLVGRITALGEGVDRSWLGRRIFAFHPHETHFAAPLQDLLPLPEDISLEDAVFLPNMETAVNFTMDGNPLIGERVVVFGQGIVGLLTTALLSDFPLDQLITLDFYPLRRRASLAAGAHACLDASDPDIVDQLNKFLPAGADLTFELSGSPLALDHAIAITGFAGRIVIGSWYGSKAELDRRRFHRSRQLVTARPAPGA
jgi:threonine dehydrogenase-like Zn-dependent dehydrogenase